MEMSANDLWHAARLASNRPLPKPRKMHGPVGRSAAEMFWEKLRVPSYFPEHMQPKEHAGRTLDETSAAIFANDLTCGECGFHMCSCKPCDEHKPECDKCGSRTSGYHVCVPSPREDEFMRMARDYHEQAVLGKDPQPGNYSGLEAVLRDTGTLFGVDVSPRFYSPWMKVKNDLQERLAEKEQACLKAAEEQRRAYEKRKEQARAAYYGNKLYEPIPALEKLVPMPPNDALDSAVPCKACGHFQVGDSHNCKGGSYLRDGAGPFGLRGEATVYPGLVDARAL